MFLCHVGHRHHNWKRRFARWDKGTRTLPDHAVAHNFWHRKGLRIGFDHGKPCREAETVLNVSTEFFTASAKWQKLYGVWSCVCAHPILHWMVGMNQNDAKLALLRMGASYSFSRPQPITGTVHGTPAMRGTDGTLNIEPHDPLSPGDRPLSGREGGAGRNAPPLSGGSVESASLQTGSQPTTPTAPKAARDSCLTASPATVIAAPLEPTAVGP